MTPGVLRVVFVVLYLFVDVIYVVSSRDFYEGIVRNIQKDGAGYPIMSGSRTWMALFAYVCMAIGWVLLVTPYIEQRAKSTATAIQGGITGGLLYGLLVYGVFNGTLHVMFKNYTMSVVVRDLTWGISWACILSTLYAYAYFRVQSKQ